ncbi:MAG: hypothetical protein BWX79_02935 [Alphaproteobacteria bacterium ADurb.Bin100]|nr:MAG: hypothetical protein BWX79_02935 [Alphaproteobacteria bacterium ADurb.Bin100]
MLASEGPCPGAGARRRASARTGASRSAACDAFMPALTPTAVAAASAPEPKRRYSW